MSIFQNIASFWSSPFRKEEKDSKTQLQELWVDTQEIDNDFEQEALQVNENSRTQEDFQEAFNKAKSSWRFNEISEDELIDKMLMGYKNKWLTIEWVDIDAELWLSQPKEEIIEDKDIDNEEEWGFWEGLASAWKSIKIEWTESFEWGASRGFKDAGIALANLPWDTIEWIWEVVELISSPVDTYNSFIDLGEALSAKVVYPTLNKVFWKDVEIPGGKQEIITALSNQLEENFWTVWKAKKTFIENPLDTVLFVKWALQTTGRLSKSKEITDFANSIPDPIEAQTKPIRATLDWVESLATSAQWKLTWLGKEWVEDIIKFSKTDEFGKALRWDIDTLDVVNNVEEAIWSLKSNASVKYGEDLNKILKEWNVNISFKENIDSFFKKLEGKWVEVTKWKDWKYSVKEWPNTELIEEDLKIIENITKRINSKNKDLTGIEARAFINRMWAESWKLQDQGILLDFKKWLTNSLEEVSPGFKQMNKDYKKMTTTVKNLQDTFGWPNVKIETKINKLNQALKDNQDYKKLMLSIIEESAGKNIRATLSWIASREILPRGLMGQIWVWWATWALVSWAAIIPVILTLWVASPRLLATVSRTLWVSVDTLKSFIKNASSKIPWWVSKVPVKETARQSIRVWDPVGTVLNDNEE